MPSILVRRFEKGTTNVVGNWQYNVQNICTAKAKVTVTIYHGISRYSSTKIRNN